MRRAPACRAVVTAVLLLALAAVPARAQPVGPDAGGAPAATGTPTIRLVSQTGALPPTDGELVLRFRVTDAPPDAELAFRLYPRIVDGRNRFLDTIHATDTLGAPIQVFQDLPLTNLPVDADGVTTARFGVDGRATPLLGFYLANPGVYPLVIEVRSGTGETFTQLVTHVIRLPLTRTPRNPAFAVSVIVPLRAPVAHRTDGTIDLGPWAARLAERVEVLNRHPEVPVTILPTPETVAALAATGTVAPDALRALGQRNQIVPAPYVDLDLAAWVEAGPSMEADLAHQMAIGRDTLTDLLGATTSSRTAVIDKSTTVAALAKLREAGAQQVVAPDTLFFPLPQQEFPRSLTRTFEIEGPLGVRTTAVAADTQLAAHLQDSDDAVLNAAHTLADLAVLYDDQPAFRRGAALHLPDDVSAAYLDALLAGLDAHVPEPTAAGGATGGEGTEASDPSLAGQQILAATTLDGLFAVAEAAGVDGGQAFSATGTRLEDTLVRPWFPDPPAPLGNYPNALALAHASLRSYRTLYADGDLRAIPLEELLLLSGAREFDERRKQDHLDGAVATVEAAARSVSLPAQAEVTLTATEGRIPLTVDNTGVDPIQVRIELTSDRLEFPDGRVQQHTLAPGRNTIEIKVTTLGSGLFTTQLEVRAPDGSLPMATTKFETRSTAVSGLGLAISIGAGIFLAIWWARHILRARKAKRRDPAPSGPAPSGPASEPSPEPAVA